MGTNFIFYYLEGSYSNGLSVRGLLDRSTSLYFYKRLKTSLHKPRGNLSENLFSKKCALKNNLQLLEQIFLSQPVLRIRDVYPGSGFFPSRIPDPKKYGEVKIFFYFICFLTFL
jgi:hypothetical protein